MKITRTKPISRSGFTLVEMLVVILVIAVLAGMILFSVRKIGDKNAKADTVQKIEKLRAAVEEFYAEYGQYPPVPSYDGVDQPIYYELPSHDTLSKAGSLKGNSDWKSGPIFTFGLMAYLDQRYSKYTNSIPSNLTQAGADLINGNTQWSTNNNYIDTVHEVWGDQPRDVHAMKRWMPFLSKITITVPRGEMLNGSLAYTNQVITVQDGWGRDLHYHSDPPYQSYDIWSVGGDGQDGGWLGKTPPADPVAAAKMAAAAADDIHSGAGH